MPHAVRAVRISASRISASRICASRICASAVALGLAGAAGAQPQPAPATTDGYVTLRGTDTVAVERVTRDAAGSVISDLRLAGASGAAGLRLHTRTAARPDGATTRIDAEVTPPGAMRAAQRVSIVFGPGDSATVRAGDNAPQRVAAAPGAVAYTELSMVSFEHIVRRARALGGGAGRPATVPVLLGARTLPATVAFPGGDSVLVTIGPATVRLAIGADGRALGLTVPAQGVRTVRVDASAVRADASALPATQPVDYAAPRGAPYTAEEVRVLTPGGFSLAGTLTLPAGTRRAAPAPVVVTLTGSGPQTRDERLPGIDGYALFRQLADTLGRRGVGVLRLDDRGVGASGGTFARATTRDFSDDARAALAWLRARAAERGDVDARRLALLGHSEGALVAPMVAADDPAVAAVVLMAAPARPGRAVSIDQQRAAITRAMPAADAAARETAFVRNLAVADSLARGGGWLGYWWTYDPLLAAQRVRAPVLVLQGATDEQVTPGQADTLAAAMRAAGNHDVTVRVFPATNHLFVADAIGAPSGYAALPSKAVRPAVLGAAADWLAARLHAALR